MLRRTLLAVALLSSSLALAQPPDIPKINRVQHPVVTLETTKGIIKIVVYTDITPKTAENFLTLVKKGFYNGLTFHRVEPGSLAQGGDPKGDGTGGPGHSVPNEKSDPLKHNRGAVAMANSGRDTAGSQFYIVLNKPAPKLDEKEPDGVNKYTVFGQVIVGQKVAESLKVGDKIKKATVK